MKKSSFFTLILFVLVLSACNFVINQNKVVADLTGNQGLVLNVDTSAKSLYQGQGMEIPVIIENAGTFDVENAIVAIMGYDSENIMMSSPTIYEGINLEGKTELVPMGEKTTKIFTIGSVALPNAKEKLQVLSILTCYQYKTQASPMVCINPQWAYKSSAQGCTNSEAQLSSSQGAPVAVSRVVTSYFENKREVQFDIFVKDASGKGVVLTPSSYAKSCLGQTALDTGDQGKVMIEAFMSKEKLRCYSASSEEESDTFTISPEGDTYAARCKAYIDPNTPAYTTPLSVYLTYGYVSGQTIKVTIKNPAFKG